MPKHGSRNSRRKCHAKANIKDHDLTNREPKKKARLLLTNENELRKEELPFKKSRSRLVAREEESNNKQTGWTRQTRPTESRGGKKKRSKRSQARASVYTADMSQKTVREKNKKQPSQPKTNRYEKEGVEVWGEDLVLIRRC